MIVTRLGVSFNGQVPGIGLGDRRAVGAPFIKDLQSVAGNIAEQPIGVAFKIRAQVCFAAVTPGFSPVSRVKAFKFFLAKTVFLVQLLHLGVFQHFFLEQMALQILLLYRLLAQL